MRKEQVLVIKVTDTDITIPKELLNKSGEVTVKVEHTKTEEEPTTAAPTPAPSHVTPEPTTTEEPVTTEPPTPTPEPTTSTLTDTVDEFLNEK